MYVNEKNKNKIEIIVNINESISEKSSSFSSKNEYNTVEKLGH